LRDRHQPEWVIGFTGMRNQDWKQLLDHFYEPFPTVEHYEPVFSV